MFYFWLILGLILFVLIFGTVLALWVDTVIYIKYINGNLNLKIKNIFYSYNYPSKKKTSRHQKNSAEDDNSNSDNDDLEQEKQDSIEKNKNEQLLNILKDFDETKTIVILIKDIIKYLRYKAFIKKLEIKVDYGKGDAAETGIVCGAFWTGYGIILPILVNYFYLTNPSVQFVPWFNDKLCEIKFESIIKVKIGHIINTLILSGVSFLKRKLNR